MKLFFLPLLAAACIMLAGCKKDTLTTTVVLDCTGSYLRFEKKDYQVCNTAALTRFSNGDVVNASFDRLKGCEAEKDRVVCMMLHASEGWIEVTSIKPN